MTPRLCGLLLLGISAALAVRGGESAPTPAAAIDRLPEVIARRGGDVVLRTELEPALQAEPLAAHLAAQPDEMLPTVRRLAEQKIGMKILLARLRGRGIAVDAETARSYIDRHTRRFGVTPAAQRLRRQLESLAASPSFQLKAALHRYFEETVPKAVEVSDQELERIYRLDQKRFMLAPRVDCGVIALRRDRKDAERTAENVAARLRQGEAFERVAAEVDPEGAGGVIPPPEKIAGLAEGDVVIIPGAEMIQVVMLRKRIPAAFVPFADVAPFLAEELAAARVGRAMEELLTAELAAEPIRFAPEVLGGAVTTPETAPRQTP